MNWIAFRSVSPAAAPVALSSTQALNTSALSTQESQPLPGLNT